MENKTTTTEWEIWANAPEGPGKQGDGDRFIGTAKTMGELVEMLRHPACQAMGYRTVPVLPIQALVVRS